MTCKEHILAHLKRSPKKWVSSKEIEEVGRHAHYLGGTATRAARKLAELGLCTVSHRKVIVFHSGKPKNVYVSFYQHKK